LFFFSSRRRHTRFSRDWSSDVCSSDLNLVVLKQDIIQQRCQYVLTTIRHHFAVGAALGGGRQDAEQFYSFLTVVNLDVPERQTFGVFRIVGGQRKRRLPKPVQRRLISDVCCVFEISNFAHVL